MLSMNDNNINPMVCAALTMKDDQLPGTLSQNASYVTGDYPLLTESQEFQLLQDQDLGSMVNNLLGNQDNWKERQYIFQDNLLGQQVLNNNQHIQAQQLEFYPVVPDVIPAINNIPPPMPSLVSNEDYFGPLGFELFIIPQTGSKTPWVYSSMLNKLFIAMSTPFPIDFKCDSTTKGLFIRATPIFSLAQHSQDLVARCIAHSTPNEATNRGLPEFIWHHVIRCQNSNAVYQGCVDENARLSVIVPLEKPQTGTDCVRILYTFVCKNSCPSGMNRKPFEVVFTLEDEKGFVYGRSNLSVRVCSCPKRDKEKEEKIHIKENSSPLPPPTAGKKKKLLEKKVATTDEPTDNKVYTVNFDVCGKHNLMLLLKLGHSLMTADLVEHGSNENIKKCLEGLAEKRRRLE